MEGWLFILRIAALGVSALVVWPFILKMHRSYLKYEKDKEKEKQNRE